MGEFDQRDENDGRRADEITSTMTKIARSNDCGNSPKNAFAEEFAIAMMTTDQSKLEDLLVADSVWIRPGEADTVGRSDIIAAVNDAFSPPLRSVTIQDVLTHGRSGAVSGLFIRHDGTKWRFAEIIRFGSAKGNSVAVVKSHTEAD